LSHSLINPRELDVEVEVGTADEVHDGPAVKEAVGTTVVEVEESTAIEVQHGTGTVRHVCSSRRARFTTNLSIYFVISNPAGNPREQSCQSVHSEAKLTVETLD
jgi:hypothetical protein